MPLTHPPRPLRLPAPRYEADPVTCRAAVPRRSGVSCVAARSAPSVQSAPRAFPRARREWLAAGAGRTLGQQCCP